MNEQSLIPINDQCDTQQQSLLEQTLVGELLGIVFRSADGQYAVARIVTAKGQEERLVGNVGDLFEGQQIEAKGHWENHQRYGKQFRATAFREVLPTSEYGIRRYLACGILPGIGPKLADRIVDRFGVDTLKVLDQYSSRLSEVPGLGKGRLKQIREVWRAQSQRRESFIFLQGLGVSLAYCNRVMAKYGDEAPAIVKENPYRLAQEVAGIGFKMADGIAERLSIGKDNPFRLGSGVVYALSQLTDRQGHCCCPKAELIKQAAEVLEVPESLAETGLTRAVDDGAAIGYCPPGRADVEIIYPVHLYRAETRLASQLRDKLRMSCTSVDVQNHATSQWSSLNADQKEAVFRAFAAPLSIITGGPGVGKTTVTREIVATANSAKFKFLLAAPTGRAAKRLAESSGAPASTIHRLLKWQPEGGSFKYNRGNQLEVDLLVIDEVSMLDLVLADHLFQAIPESARVVLVGDRDQLPSIGPGKVLADLIRCGKVAVTHLKEIYRQSANSRIVINAHRLNQGVMPELNQSQDELSDFYWIEQEDQEKVIALICKMVVDRIPNRFSLSALHDVQVLTPFNRGRCGTTSLNKELQGVLNPKCGKGSPLILGDAEYRIGDRVMQTANNYDLGVFNGDLGAIQEINDTDRKFTVRYEASLVTYDWSDLDQLRLAYSITIHKSQGSEFPAVIVPVLSEHFVMLRRNLIYTAMTRASKLLVMVGSKKALAMAVNNYRETFRYTELAPRISSGTK